MVGLYMTLQMDKNKGYYIPLTSRLQSYNIGDCRLSLFSHLLQFYEMKYTPADIMGYSSGLDFQIHKINTKHSLCFGVSGRAMEIEEEFAEIIGLKIEKRRAFLDDGIARSQCCEELISCIKNGRPIFASIDRFYLDYLKIKKAHMPFHAVILNGYDIEKKSFWAVDSLVDDYVEIDREVMLDAMFATSTLKAEAVAEWFVVEKDTLTNVTKPTLKQILEKQCEKYHVGGGMQGNFVELIRFLKSMQKKMQENKNHQTYMKYQVAMLYNQIRDQDFEHYFYRNLYFSFLENRLESREFQLMDEKHFLNLINKDRRLWLKLSQQYTFGSDVKKRHIRKLIYYLEAILKVEDEIFSKLSICE